MQKNLLSWFSRRWSFKSYLIAAVLIMVAGFFISRKSATMSPNWTGPYLSCAANLKIGKQFLIDSGDTKQFLELDNREAEFQYKFATSENLTHYNHNPIGYAYLIKIAKTMFPTVGDMRAIVWLQIFSHTMCCLTILLLLKSPQQKILFTMIYGLNPVVLYVTGINFYYFWQVIPATVLLVVYLLYWHDRDRLNISPVSLAIASALAGFVLGLVFVTRPTIIGFIALGCILLLCKSETRVKSFFPMALCFCASVFMLWQPTEKNFWHTVYVGLGSYPNKFVPELSDNQGYGLYTRSTGIELEASFGGNYYDTETIHEYQKIAKAECLTIARQDPFMFLRNAALNTLQGFNIGYLNDFSFSVHLLISAIGFAVIAVLIFFKEWFVVYSCLFGLLSFTPYYPPIPAYMFGNYILLAFGLVSIVDSVWKKASGASPPFQGDHLK